MNDATQLGSTGAYNIVKKIPINAPFGSVIYENEIINVDYNIDPGKPAAEVSQT